MTEDKSTSRRKDKIRKITDINWKNYLGWLSYDVANTFYAGGILQLMILTWVLVKGQQNGLTYAQSNGIFQITLSAASIFMAFMLPILGSLSDVLNERKRFVLVFSAITIISTFVFSILDNIYLILLLFAISLITYQWAQVAYDAMLQGVVPPGKEGQLSGLAIATGYLGGASVIVYATFISSDAPNADPTQGPLTLGYFPELILLIVVGFFLFSLPLLFVKETDWASISAQTQGDTIDIKDPTSVREVVKASFTELKDTFIGIKNDNLGMFFYIISYFIIADFANLIVLINAAYLRDALKIGEDLILYSSIVFGSSIILFSYFVGKLADKYGAKTSFQFIGVLWTISLSLMILINFPINLGIITLKLPKEIIYVAAIMFGPAFSGVWISQRQMVLELVPTEQEIGRYFGLTKFSGKISSAVGPLLWASLILYAEKQLEYSIAGSYRFALISMTIFLLLGFLLLHFKVPNQHKEFKERKESMLKALEQSDY